MADVTLLLVMNLGFAWGATTVSPGEVASIPARTGLNKRYTYNYGYRYIRAGVAWTSLLLSRLAL